MKKIIFDIDGTLTDTKYVDDTCYKGAFHQVFGIDLQDQDWTNFQHVTDQGITEEIFLNRFNRFPSPDEYNIMINEFIRLLEIEKTINPSLFKAVKGAKNFILHLKETTDYPLGIATGGWERSARLKLEAAGITLNGIAFSNSNHHKSRQEIIKDVIKQLSNLVSEQVIYFGDGLWDLETCQELGIKFLGIDILNNNKLRDAGATTVHSNFVDIPGIMADIEK